MTKWNIIHKKKKNTHVTNKLSTSQPARQETTEDSNSPKKSSLFSRLLPWKPSSPKCLYEESGREIPSQLEDISKVSLWTPKWQPAWASKNARKMKSSPTCREPSSKGFAPLLTSLKDVQPYLKPTSLILTSCPESSEKSPEQPPMPQGTICMSPVASGLRDRNTVQNLPVYQKESSPQIKLEKKKYPFSGKNLSTKLELSKTPRFGKSSCSPQNLPNTSITEVEMDTDHRFGETDGAAGALLLAAEDSRFTAAQKIRNLPTNPLNRGTTGCASNASCQTLDSDEFPTFFC